MVFARPGIETQRVNQEAEDLRQPRLVFVEPDQLGEPLLRFEIRIGDPPLEQVVEI
jgi:hypothetical protein